MLISQDGLKAISAADVKFFVISKDRNERGKFNLLAKTPAVSGNYYDYLALFEHENIEVVKHVMRFLANNKVFIPHDAEEKNVLVIDLPDLYRHGMKEIAPELLTAKQTAGV